MSTLPVICAREDLVDGGRAKRFAIEYDGRSFSAFVIAFEGGVHAWVNNCPHRGTELDWQPGEVFDDSGLYLVCATHGALFEADSGLCVSGPCVGAGLKRVAVSATDDGQVVLQKGRLLNMT
jgi:nitrite reductase/ring-hydroxylating ferredoxin subunit